MVCLFFYGSDWCGHVFLNPWVHQVSHGMEEEISGGFLFGVPPSPHPETHKKKLFGSPALILLEHRAKSEIFGMGKMQTSLSPASAGEQTFHPGLPLVWQFYVVFFPFCDGKKCSFFPLFLIPILTGCLVPVPLGPSHSSVLHHLLWMCLCLSHSLLQKFYPPPKNINK